MIIDISGFVVSTLGFCVCSQPSLRCVLLAMAKRESDETRCAEAKRSKPLRVGESYRLTNLHTICVSIGCRDIALNEVPGFRCLSYVRREALQKLRKVCDDFKGCSEWDYDIVHMDEILPSRRQDFMLKKHYTCEYLEAEDSICLVPTDRHLRGRR